MERQDLQDELLSVIVPVYKVEQYLDRCVESLVHQTYRNLEIILVDDGSPDRCPEMCDQWKNKDSRIRVIHQGNAGLSAARNAGIDAAKGEYLAFVDSDDYVELNMYESMLQTMKNEQADIACCGRYLVKGDSLKEMHSMQKKTIFSGKEAVRELLIGGYIEESACDKVYKKHLFSNVYFPVGEINEDVVVMPKLLCKAEKIVHVGQSFYYYWQNSASITRSTYSDKKRIILKHLDDIEQYLQTTHKDLMPYFEVLQCRYCQSTLYLLLDNRETYLRYQDDYKEFFSRFKRSFRTSLKLGKADRASRVKGLLIYFNLYFILHSIKKGRKK